MSWTGSETQRREQRGCSAGGYVPTYTPKYRIPAGTAIEVCRVEDSAKQWQEHTTTRILDFEKHEGYQNKCYTFRELGYFIRVRAFKVNHREEFKPKPPKSKSPVCRCCMHSRKNGRDGICPECHKRFGARVHWMAKRNDMNGGYFTKKKKR